jgi:NTE family protein
MSTRVALALGSGGARGYAHIGVLQVLHERGYEIVGISGSSMGAVVGGVQAAGRLDELATGRALATRALDALESDDDEPATPAIEG